MKKLSLSLLLTLSVASAQAQAPSTPAMDDATSADADTQQDPSVLVPPDKMKSLMQRGRYLERQIQVRQKNANQRHDASAQQYNLGYQDGYNKALLDLLHSQLLNGVKLPSQSLPGMPATSVPTLPPVISQPTLTRPVENSAMNTRSTPMPSQTMPTPSASAMPTVTPIAPNPASDAGANQLSQTPATTTRTAPVPALVPATSVPALPLVKPSASGSTSLRAAPSSAKTLNATSVSNATNTSAAPAAPATDANTAAQPNVFEGKSIPTLTTAANGETDKPGKQFDHFMNLSTQALQNKQWKQASEYASRAISLKNDVASSYINRSWALAELGDTQQALVDANLAIQLQPKMGLAYNNRAYTYELMENLPEARKDYQRACQFGFSVACSVLPKIERVLAQQASAKHEQIKQLAAESEQLIRARNWPEVIKVSSKILNLDSNYTSAYINRAWARAETGQMEASLADAGKAIIINPKDPIAYNNRAYTYELMNDLQSARRDYAKACEFKLASACQVVAKIDQLQKSKHVATQTAKPQVRKSTKAPSQKQTIQQLITSSFEKFREGNWNAVEQLSNKILKLDPNNALAYVNRAGARTEMGLVYNALDDIERAIQINPKLGIAYNNKGYTLERMGDTAKARAQYQKACNLGLQQSCKDFKRLSSAR